MQPFWIISLSLLAVYILRVFTYMLGWRRLPGKIRGIAGEFPGVSLVIPLRDEEKNIGFLLEDLVKQEYPAEAYEIIIVDDHSTDNTPEIIRSFQERHHGLRLLYLDLSETGKKAALQKGIESAIHPLILTSDGDCRVSSKWVAGMVAGFSDLHVRMVIGTVIFDPDRGFLRSMQSLEFFSLCAVSAGAAGLNDPILCNAANLAYYRDDYLRFVKQQVKVSESGDDIFLMLWLKKQHPGSIRFSAFPDAVVRTRPAESLRSFIMQRMRWTSKSRYYRDLHMCSTAILVFGLNALLLAVLLAAIWEGRWMFLFGILFLCKSITELFFLAPILRYYGKVRLLRYFVPLGIVYFMYVSLIGLSGQFLSFSWKGRRIPAFNKSKTIGKGQ